MICFAVLFLMNTAGAEDLRYELALSSCRSGEEIVLPSEQNGRKVVAIRSRCFAEDEEIMNAVVPETIVSIGDYAFSGSSLCSIVFEGDSLEYIGAGAFELTDLEEIVLPAHVDHMMEGVFGECEALRTVKLPEDLDELPSLTFQYCVSLRSVDIPDQVRIIRDNAFMGCEELKDIRFPKNLDQIGESAFEACVSLETVVLPKGLRIIDSRAFCECEELSSCTIPASVVFIAGDAFEDASDDLVLVVQTGSYALEYAVSHGINYTVI